MSKPHLTPCVCPTYVQLNNGGLFSGSGIDLTLKTIHSALRHPESQYYRLTHMALLSAQMEGHHPLPGAVPDNIPDGFRFVQWRRFSFDLPTSPTRRELYDLQVELDHQCLQHVAGVESEHDVISEANWAKAAALRLSEPLNEVRHPRSSEFYQIQFRALIASLALLNHIGVAALDQSPWNRLNDALTAQFGSIAYQTNPDTTLSENMVHTTNLYLIQLASKYMSFIPRGGSVVPLIAGPAITIVFATLAIVSQSAPHGCSMADSWYGCRLVVSITMRSEYSKLSTSCLHSCGDPRPDIENFASYKNTYVL